MSESPLSGITVLVTRAVEQAAVLEAPLAALGARVILTPSIRFEEPDDWTPADAALRRAASYDWAIFTSANGVEAVSRRLEAIALSWEAFRGVRLVAIGPATAGALAEHALPVEAVPERYRAEGILSSLSSEPISGHRILLARAAKARDVLPEELKRKGARLDDVVVYRTKGCAPSAQAMETLARFASAKVVVTFTSSSTVTSFLDRLPPEAIDGLRKCTLAAIGPVTSEELVRRGFPPRIIPGHSTVPALVEAIRSHFAS